MNPETTTPTYADDEIDLLELWDIIAEQWRWIAGTAGAFAVVSIIAALLMTPIYRAEVVIVPAEQNSGSGLMSQLGGLADLAGVSVGGGDKSEGSVVLRSRDLIAKFIEDRALLPILFDDDWDSEKKAWKSTDPEDAPTLNKAIKLFSDEVLKVTDDKKSGAITVAVEWKDPQLAADWANELVKRANAAMRQRAIEEAQASVDYLSKELQKTTAVEIQQAIYRLMEANFKTISTANARSQYAFKIVDPARAPDLDQKVRPKRSLIVILATLAGGFLAVIGVFLVRAVRNMRAERASRA